MENEKSPNKKSEEPRAKQKQTIHPKIRKTIIWKMRKVQTRSLKNQEEAKDCNKSNHNLIICVQCRNLIHK